VFNNFKILQRIHGACAANFLAIHNKLVEVPNLIKVAVLSRLSVIEKTSICPLSNRERFAKLIRPVLMSQAKPSSFIFSLQLNKGEFTSSMLSNQLPPRYGFYFPIFDLGRKFDKLVIRLTRMIGSQIEAV